MSIRFTLLLAAICWRLAAQTALTGAIQGTVTDETGSAIPNSTVEISSASLGYSGSQTTDTTGSFRFVRLGPDSDYRLIVASSAFEKWTATGVSVPSGEVSTLNITLRIGKQSESVNIEAAAPAISTDSAELATPINSRALNTLPTNGRIITRFALLDSRVRNANAFGGDGSNQYRLSINANTFRDSQHRLDGNTNYDTLFNNIPLQRVPLSGVQEFRVLTNQFTAEHGSTSSGLTITTTKSGTDNIHGELLRIPVELVH